MALELALERLRQLVRHHDPEGGGHAFAGLQHQLRVDVGKVDEPQLKALLEESAEVMGALAQTFEDYQRKGESTWQQAN